MIYVITATGKRNAQLADLTRLGQTLSTIPSLLWLVVEDAKETSLAVGDVLMHTGARFVHLSALLEKGDKLQGLILWIEKVVVHHRRIGRGMGPRDAGIDWLDGNVAKGQKGVAFFADDDNAYDRRLFEHYIRKVKKVGVWPIGFTGGSLVSFPKVDKEGRVKDFKAGWSGSRAFQLDMAQFAVNLDVLRSKQPRFTKCKVLSGLYEDCFVRQLGVPIWELEPFGIKEKVVRVWHLRTKENTEKYPLMTKFGFTV